MISKTQKLLISSHHQNTGSVFVKAMDNPRSRLRFVPHYFISGNFSASQSAKGLSLLGHPFMDGHPAGLLTAMMSVS